MRLMREYEERRRYDHESGTRELQAASEPTLPWPTVPSEASKTQELTKPQPGNQHNNPQCLENDTFEIPTIGGPDDECRNFQMFGCLGFLSWWPLPRLWMARRARGIWALYCLLFHRSSFVIIGVVIALRLLLALSP